MPDQSVTDATLARARAAHERGDTLLQLTIECGQLAGGQSSWGSSDNFTVADPDVGWLLGHIEAIGWRLTHCDFVFIETGSSSSARLLSTGEGTVNRGSIQGFYLFRRT